LSAGGASFSWRDPAAFVWRDGDRVLLFAPAIGENPETILAERGLSEYDLFSTARALAEAEQVASSAAEVHEVAPGPVPEAAAELLGRVSSPTIVALGGGRVIDTAKAVAAVEGQRVVAIPTTLSGAEMTGIHRLPAGAEDRSQGLVRPQAIYADPFLMTGLPEGPLRASAMNALAHGADSLYTPFANPLSRMAALRGASLIGEALDQDRDGRDRSALALGSILCGYAIDSASFAIHHVICQTLVRELRIPHAETNAAILPRAMDFMRDRAPEQIADLAEALGSDLESLADRIAKLGRPSRLGELGADRAALDGALDAIEARPDLARTPDPPSREELKALIEAAW
jgi:alcohol dehydrogenase class IV